MAVENFVGMPATRPMPPRCCWPRSTGSPPDVEHRRRPASREIGRANGATEVRVAADDDERALLWKGRKTAFGAIAQIAPDYYLHDTVVPRSALADVLDQIYEIAERHDLLVMNVFHAGDGNLHPLLLFDGREPGVLERVHAAGAEIVAASLAVGGVLSGEHGIGVEKQQLHGRAVHRRRPRSSEPTPRRPSTRPVEPTRARCCRWVTAVPTSRRCARSPREVWG